MVIHDAGKQNGDDIQDVIGDEGVEGVEGVRSPEGFATASTASTADRRMAAILGAEPGDTAPARAALRREQSEDADDLLGRLDVLDFIDSVVGEASDVPQRIGEFEITGVLGRGGMGTVYKAYQPSLDREVALKVLAPRFSSDPTMRGRFRKEAKATAAMHHQHIVPIYGYGEAGGHLFFAMERVHGDSLDKCISAARRAADGRHALDPLDAARRFAGVADALALAHKRQILHRDVKPGNILVQADGTLALADFGLSKFLGEVSGHLTSVGGFLGTLYYAPPEQARGEPLSPASDLYSLGVTMFEAITGELPLRGDSTESMLQALLHEEPRRVRDLLPRVPRDLDAVIEKLLQKRPVDRYQDGEALSLDLLRVSQGEPVRIRRRGLARRLYRKMCRHPAIATLATASVVMLLVTGLWMQSITQNADLTRRGRGRQHLVDAAIAVAREPGLALGPAAILNALTGHASHERDSASGFERELDAAERILVSESTTLSRYRRCYYGGVFRAMDAEDPMPLLMRGNGIAAVQATSEKIRAIEQAANTFDLGVQIDLYNLYLVRALASLSASVSDQRAALNDLRVAGFIRAGAFLPRMLRAFLDDGGKDGKGRKDTEQLLRSLEPFAEDGDPMHRVATAQMLLAFSGIGAPTRSHLMGFDMPYSERRSLCLQAHRWLGTTVRMESEASYRGLERELALHLRRLLADLGIQSAMARSLSAARRLLATSVGPTSPLQAWRHAFDLLADRPIPVDAPGQQEGALHVVRTIIDSVPRRQARGYLDRWMPRLDAIIAADPSTDAAARLRALCRAYGRGGAEALDAVAEWLRRDPRHPEGYLCRFLCQLEAGIDSDVELIEAMTTGQHAWDCAIDAERMRARLVDVVEAHVNGPDAPVRALAGHAQSLLADLRGSLSAGGR